MNKFGTQLLDDSTQQRLYMRKEKKPDNGNSNGNGNGHDKIYKQQIGTKSYDAFVVETEEKISSFQLKFKNLSNASSTIIINKLSTAITYAADLLDLVNAIADEATYNKVKRIKRKMEDLKASIDDNTITENLEIRKAVKDIYKIVSKLKLGEDKLSNFVDSSKALCNLKTVRVKAKKTDIIHRIKAPLLLVLNSQPKQAIARLSRGIDLKLAANNYVYIEDMTFLVVNIKKMRKDMPHEEQLIEAIRHLNRRSEVTVVPFFDFSKKIGKFMIVSLVPDNYASSLEEIKNSSANFQIMLEIDK